MRATISLMQRSNPHVAAQLARIDRMYGTPITTQWIAWLRSLGVDELALPIAPLPGRRISR